MLTRNRYQFGQSTLQGGGVNQIEIERIVESKMGPDFDAEWVRLPTDNYVVGSDSEAFGYQYPDFAELDLPVFSTRSLGSSLLVSRPPIIDRYNLASEYVFDENFSAGILAGTNNLKTADHDLSRGVFQFGGIVKTAPSAIGERGMAIVLLLSDYEVFDVEQGLTPTGTFLLYDEAVLPTTSIESTLAFVSPELYIDFDDYKRRVDDYWKGRGLETRGIEALSGLITLNIHQTSGSELEITYIRLWFKKVRDWPAPVGGEESA